MLNLSLPLMSRSIHVKTPKHQLSDSIERSRTQIQQIHNRSMSPSARTELVTRAEHFTLTCIQALPSLIGLGCMGTLILAAPPPYTYTVTGYIVSGHICQYNAVPLNIPNNNTWIHLYPDTCIKDYKDSLTGDKRRRCVQVRLYVAVLVAPGWTLHKGVSRPTIITSSGTPRSTMKRIGWPGANSIKFCRLWGL